MYCDGGQKNINNSYIFDLQSGMLLQCMAIVVKKLQVDADKTTAFVKKKVSPGLL